MSAILLADDRPTARKQHRCEVCNGTIAIGERYVRQRGIFDGAAYTWKGHALCATAQIKAHRDLDLPHDEGVEPEEALPYIERFFAVLSSPLFARNDRPA